MDTPDTIQPMLPGDFSPSASEHLQHWQAHMQARQRNRKIAKELGSSTLPMPQSQHTVHAVFVVGPGPLWARQQWAKHLWMVLQSQDPGNWHLAHKCVWKAEHYGEFIALYKTVLRGGSMTALIFISRITNKQNNSESRKE